MFGLLIWITGLILLIFPDSVWNFYQWWNSREEREGTDSYIIIIRIVSFALIAIGFLVQQSSSCS